GARACHGPWRRARRRFRAPRPAHRCRARGPVATHRRDARRCERGRRAGRHVHRAAGARVSRHHRRVQAHLTVTARHIVLRGTVLLAASLLAASCATAPPAIGPQLPDDAPVERELTHVPFFPQEDYQCGPAALATVLAASGVDVTADALTRQVYLPGRRGSLQTELIAATRRHDRLPYRLEGGLPALLAQVDAGHPVVVLQNLGFKRWPRWHYAVVVGYSAADGTLMLRSGTTRRLSMPVWLFQRT